MQPRLWALPSPPDHAATVTEGVRDVCAHVWLVQLGNEAVWVGGRPVPQRGVRDASAAAGRLVHHQLGLRQGGVLARTGRVGRGVPRVGRLCAACDATAIQCWKGLTCGAGGTWVSGVSVTTGGHFCTADADCAQATGTSVCDRVGRPVGAPIRQVQVGGGRGRRLCPRVAAPPRRLCVHGGLE